jgi:hypothetical protein
MHGDSLADRRKRDGSIRSSNWGCLFDTKGLAQEKSYLYISKAADVHLVILLMNYPREKRHRLVNAQVLSNGDFGGYMLDDYARKR